MQCGSYSSIIAIDKITTNSLIDVMHDHSFTYIEDNSPSASALETTPSNRLQPLKLLSDKTKARVDSATVATEGRCLITNINQEYAVEYAHVLQQAASDTQLTKLEYSWGKPVGTLNVDTHLNIFRLRADIHSLFDKGLWLLLPQKEILERYQAGETPVFQASAGYTYTLAASSDMFGYPIQRLTSPVRHDPGLGPEIKTFLFPFLDFPYLVSHVHPAFVICHAGKFLSNVDILIKYVEGPRDIRDLLLLVQVYKKWNKTQVSSAFLASPMDENDNESSVVTRPQRLTRRAIQRNIERDNNDGPSTSSKRKRSSDHHDSACLDDEALHIQHAGLTTQHVARQKQEFVEGWVSSIAGEVYI